MSKTPLSSSLSDVSYLPQSARTLPVRVGEPHTKAITEACTVLKQAGHRHEVEAMLTEINKPEPMFRATSSSTALSGDVNLIAHKEEVSEQERWALSLRAWAQCVEHGPETALKTIPFLLWVDCAFFLGQRWVRNLIADWHQKGEKKKIERLLFGTGKRGNNDLRRTLEDLQRDIQITDHIDYLIQEKGYSLRHAYKAVSIPFRITPTNAQARYAKRKHGYDPLAALLSDE